MLPAPLYRFLWRWLRRPMLEPGPGNRASGIERYSVFQGHLHIKGAIEAPARVQALALHMPGGEVLPLRFDPAGPARAGPPAGPGRSGDPTGPGLVGFDQLIAVPGTPREAA